MADTLDAGGMGKPSEIGVPANFANSMADYIERAYWHCLDNDRKDTFDTSGNRDGDRDRRRIFVAIAQGVVQYLHDHQGAFRVTGTALPVDIAVAIDTEVPTP